ncbi:hypothetical protein B0J11DRAFT_541185 [Dendryphion nanum]|uniref:Uncharacterized protein n=1 Tax=Dendryphion nanum TaxID=256645 RepID=A0A9P9D6N0_9PLEO|nr:hypothetical protein B0J11DRAFT_541185 [Dendryphion nanum]
MLRASRIETAMLVLYLIVYEARDLSYAMRNTIIAIRNVRIAIPELLLCRLRADFVPLLSFRCLRMSPSPIYHKPSQAFI